MKTVEQKAKRYDEALERARLSRLQLLDIGEEATEIEYIFPELMEESEDEFECSNGSVLSLKQIEKYYNIIK